MKRQKQDRQVDSQPEWQADRQVEADREVYRGGMLDITVETINITLAYMAFNQYNTLQDILPM